MLTLLLVLLVSNRGSFGYWTTSSSPARHSSETKSMRKSLPNFGEATTTLYRSGQPSKGGFRILAEMGVNIVVDLRGSRDSERKIVTHLGMQYVALSWQCSFPKDKTFAQFLPLLRKNRGKKIFVHCRLGDDRTAMMIASYRIAERGLVCRKSREGNGEIRFFLHPQTSDLPGLSSYEEHFPQRFKTGPHFGTCVRRPNLDRQHNNSRLVVEQKRRPLKQSHRWWQNCMLLSQSERPDRFHACS